MDCEQDQKGCLTSTPCLLDVIQVLLHQDNSFGIVTGVVYVHGELLYIQVLIRIIVIDIISRIRVIQNRPSCCSRVA
jgi:hypothetical protein